MVSLMLSPALVDVGSHCAFFNRLADLVDPKFYHADDDREHINTKYLKRAERTAVKRVFKEQHKQNKRAKLDPDAIKTTTELQRAQAEAAAEQHQQQQQQQQQQQPGGRGQAAVQQMGVLHLSAAGPTSREDLLKRLHDKVEAARQARNANGDAAGGSSKQQSKQQQKQTKQQSKQQSQQQSPAADAKQWRSEQLGKKLKTQQQQQQQQQQTGQKRKLEQQSQQQQPKTKQQQQQQQGGGLAFSKLVVDAGRPGAAGVATGGRHKKAKLSKEAALKEAEQKQQRLADAAARQDKEALAAEAWRAALSRAAGEKVLDDPKLLRRSIKRERADKARAAKRWQERVTAQGDAQRARQDRRKDNLAARVATKLENKKAKREKKLLRAGFEGRKSGFINAGGKK